MPQKPTGQLPALSAIRGVDRGISKTCPLRSCSNSVGCQGISRLVQFANETVGRDPLLTMLPNSRMCEPTATFAAIPVRPTSRSLAIVFMDEVMSFAVAAKVTSPAAGKEQIRRQGTKCGALDQGNAIWAFKSRYRHNGSSTWANVRAPAPISSGPTAAKPSMRPGATGSSAA